MIVEEQILINSTKESAWAVIADVKNSTDVLKGVIKIDVINESSNNLVGLKCKETRMYFGKPASIDKWITDASVNKFYKTRAESDGFVFITTMSISESDKGIILTSTHETKTIGFVAKLKSLPMIFFKGMLKKAILSDLNDYKTAIEKKG